MLLRNVISKTTERRYFHERRFLRVLLVIVLEHSTRVVSTVQPEVARAELRLGVAGLQVHRREVPLVRLRREDCIELSPERGEVGLQNSVLQNFSGRSSLNPLPFSMHLAIHPNLT